MKKLFLTLLSAVVLMPAMASNNVAPWGWATCSDESGTAFTLSGGCFTDATTVTLQALGDGQSDDSQIKTAIATKDIIIFDGSNGDFILNEYIKVSAKNKTIIGINNARLCTKFFLTADDITYLKQQNLDGLSSTDTYTGTLPDGTEITCDKRAFFTKKAMMELQHQKTGVYSLPNKAGIFSIGEECDNIIIRNLSLIGPGSVDIDGVDLITNMGTHVWVDHCTFVDSQDGALDSKRCDWATYTYNYFYYTSRSYSHAYTCGCGWADGQMTLHLTFASNIWGAGCVRRLPQCGDCYVHLVNNYHNCPGNSVGIAINDGCKALVENNYAASGVNSPLTGSGSNRNVTVSGNNYSATGVGSTVTVPYQYSKITAANVPANLTGEEGAGATLGNDATYILSTIPTVERQEGESTLYYFIDGLVGTNSDGYSIMTFNDGATMLLNNKSKTWSNGTTIKLGDENFTSIKLSNGAENIFTAPAGKKVSGITFYSYINVKEEKIDFTTYPEYGFRTSFWQKVANLTYSVTSDDVQILKSRDPQNPDVASFNFTPTNVVSFKNSGEQFCFLMEVTYSDESTGISAIQKKMPIDGITYNLQGVRVNNPTKGIYIQNGKKVVIK